MKKLKDDLSILLVKQSTFKASLRYLIVAAIGFTIDFVLYVALIAVDISIYWASAAGFCLGVIVNVLLIRKFVFPNSRFKLITDLPLTLAVNGAILGVGLFLLWLFTSVLSINPYGAKLLSNGITFVINYVIRTVFFRSK